jgi:two-component system, sensor histidine kinase YesM
MEESNKMISIGESIKSRLVLFFFIATVIPTVIIGSISYYISVKVIEEKASRSSVKTLSHVADNIEKQVEALVQVADMVFVDNNIKPVLQTKYESDVDFQYDMRKVNDSFDTFFSYSAIGKYVSSIILLGDNSREIAIGDDGYTVPRDKLRDSLLYEEARKSNGKIVWGGTHKNLAQIWREKYVISMARQIKDERMSQGIGVAILSFRESSISDLYKNIELGDNGSIFILDGDGRVISHKDVDMLAKDLSEYTYIKSILNNNSGYLIAKLNNRRILVTYCTSRKTGWKVVETIPLSELIRETSAIRNVTAAVFVLCLIMSIIFSWIISEKISQPIKKLRITMRKIEDGDMSIRAEVSSKDEIGELSRSFNYMIGRMQELFGKVVEEQVSKKEAEYQALLSQVNPHFLYNTLNSIKWMAIIQKAEGIREMVSALGRLLQKSVKDIDKLVTIEEELSMVKDYLYIQSFRYKDKFTVIYDIDESVTKCMTCKFVLQPIIENAIFHGLEPKEGLGTIKINIERVEESILFTVEDNGVGISEEHLAVVLNGQVSNLRGFSAIGVYNVDERIKRVFGNEYGLKIRSCINEFTCVEIRIPVIEDKDRGAADA